MPENLIALEQIATITVDHGFQLHAELGPGLLESAYQAFLAASLCEAGLEVRQQVTLPATFRGITVDQAFRLDLLIEGKLIVELKSVERLLPVHSKQLLTYLRLTSLPLGLLINFGAELYRDGVKRVIDPQHAYRSPKLGYK